MDIVRISDGLGNQIFQYAFARAHALKTGRKTKLDVRFINNEKIPLSKPGVMARHNDLREYKLSYFNISLEEASEKELDHWDYLYSANPANNISSYLSHIDLWPYRFCAESGKNKSLSVFPTYYYGYYFDLKYYDDIKHELQKEITLSENNTGDLLDLTKGPNSVAVHVRRNDFRICGRDISDTNYYRNAFGIIENRIENPLFLLFSDDLKWADEMSKNKDNVINASAFKYPDYIELMIMRQCSNFIIANSTFSYWAAYLCECDDKCVVCPEGWRPAIIPDDWIRCEL